MKKILMSLFTIFSMWGLNANAALIWNWNYNGDSGTFITDGTNYSAGHYQLSDFTVDSSAIGATIGSLSGGQYTDNIGSVAGPYSFDWDGNAITQIYPSYGSYSIGFEDLNGGVYNFGDGVSVYNAYTIGFNNGFSFGTYTLTPSVSAVPLPTAVFMFAPALLGLLGFRRKVKLTV